MIKDRITQHINNRDWQGLQRLLGGLSNMEFRRAEHVVRTEVLPKLDNDLFWETLLHLIYLKRQAFIAGVTSCEHLVKDGTIKVQNEHTEALYNHLKTTNPESITKIANMLTPQLKTEQQMMDMFNGLHIDNDITRISVLLKTETPLSYYLIFKSLKMLDDRLIARKCCNVLMKRKTDMAFNATSIIKTYWAIDDLPARFSLNIEEFELNHIDRNFSNFVHILNGKRPTI